MHFGFALDLSDIDLLNIELLDQWTHLDLLDTDIPSKHFVCFQDFLKTSSRHVFKTSSKHVFKTSSRHVLKTTWRSLQRNNLSSSKASWEMSSRRFQDVFKTSWKAKNCYAEDVLKTSSRHVLKTSWRHIEDQQMFAGSIRSTQENLLEVYFQMMK